MTPPWWLFIDAGEGHAVLARACDRLAHRQLAGRKGQAVAGVDLHRAAAPCAHTRGTASPSTRPLRRCVAYCATRDSPCEPRPCDSASTSARAVTRAIALRWRRRACKRTLQPASRSFVRSATRLHASASSTLSAIRKLTRSLLSAETPAMCGVSSRFGQSSKCARPAAARCRRHRSPRRRGGRSRSAAASADLVDDAAARGVDQHGAALHRGDARRHRTGCASNRPAARAG